jgi:hypothetical protein
VGGGVRAGRGRAALNSVMTNPYIIAVLKSNRYICWFGVELHAAHGCFRRRGGAHMYPFDECAMEWMHVGKV